MSNEEEKKEIEETNEEVVAENVENIAVATVPAAGPSFKDSGRRKNERRPSRRPERARQEFDNKIISVRRVTRVVSGGRRFSFSISVVIGDKKGKVGVGIGKAADTPIAIEKAIRDAKKHMVKIALTPKGSIAHPIETKYASARVFLTPAPGKGIIAGSAVRVVLDLAGIKEVSSKILSRSKNKLNIARATIKALQTLKTERVKIKENAVS